MKLVAMESLFFELMAVDLVIALPVSMPRDVSVLLGVIVIAIADLILIFS